jgi:DNA-binding MurR/RpiR family transcriptional regulator
MTPTKKVNVKKDSTKQIIEFGGHKLSKKKKQVAFRRQAVFELMVKWTTNTYDLADSCNTSQSTIVRDFNFLKRQSVEQMKFHIHERVPWAYRLCSQGIEEVLKYAWSLILNEGTKVNKVAVLSLFEQCYKDQLEIATNAIVINEALSQLENMKQQILGFGSLEYS